MLVSFSIIRELDPPLCLPSPFAPTGHKASSLIAKRFPCKRGKHNCHFHLSHSDQSPLGYQHSNRDFCLQPVLPIRVCQQNSRRSSREFFATHRHSLAYTQIMSQPQTLNAWKCFFVCNTDSDLNRVVQHSCSCKTYKSVYLFFPIKARKTCELDLSQTKYKCVACN